MTALKTLAIVAALLAGGTSLALAQNGPATGGEHPVAGGAAGGPYYGWYGGTPGYVYRPYRGLYGYYQRTTGIGISKTNFEVISGRQPVIGGQLACLFQKQLDRGARARRQRRVRLVLNPKLTRG